MEAIKDYDISDLKELYKDKTFALDRALINPIIKLTKDYAVKVCESIYGLYIWDKCTIPWSLLGDFDMIRAYSNGKQPASKYNAYYGERKHKKGSNYVDPHGIDHGEGTKEERTGNNINKQIMSPAPQLKLAIKGALAEKDFNICADTIDPDSVDEKELEMSKRIAYGQHIKDINLAKQIAGIPQEDESQYPKTTDELNILEELGEFKAPVANCIEEVVKYTYNISDWEPQVREKIIDDYINYSQFAIWDYYDDQLCAYKTDYIDIKKLIFQYSDRRDASDSSFFAYPRLVKIADIRYKLEAAGYSEDDIRGIAMSWCGMGSVLNFYGGRANPSYSNFSNYNVYNGSSWLYDFFDILVLDTTWIENDNTYQKIKPSPLTGEPLVYREKFGKVGESTIVTTIKRRYEASWIINTKIVYDNQMSPSQPRTPDNKRPLFPYHVYIGEEESMTLRCVPAYDTFQITWLKFQIKLQELHNELFMVDMTVVDRFCKSGDFEGALKFITKLKETGIGFYRSLPPRGQYTGGNVKPVEKIPSTMMTVIDESIALFDESFKLIQQITGVNAAFMGQQPQTREAEGNVQTALNATMNILKPLVQGIMQVKEESAEFLSEAIRLAVRNDEKAYATYSRITKDIDFLKKSTFTSTQLGIKLIPRPTQQEMAQLQQEINQLAMPGKNGTPLLTAPIMMRVKEMISRGANINKIRIYVTDAVAKEQKRQEDIQKQNIQQQNDGNLKLKQEDNAGEIAKEKAKSDAKLREIQAETEGKLKVNWQQQSHERQMAQMEQDKQQSQPQPQVAMNQ